MEELIFMFVMCFPLLFGLLVIFLGEINDTKKK